MFHTSARPFGNSQPVVMQADGFSDIQPSYAGAGRWMTYDELAASRGIDRLSAVKLALRHGWRKQRDKNASLAFVSRRNGQFRDRSRVLAKELTQEQTQRLALAPSKPLNG